MVWPLEATRPVAPQIRRKHQHRQQKEDPRHLKPQHAAHAAKRAQKAAHAAGDAARSLTRHLPRRLPSLARIHGWLRRSRSSFGPGAGRHLLAGYAPGNPQSCTQNPADTLRFHLVYHGSSDDCGAAFHSLFAIRHCPRSKPEVR